MASSNSSGLWYVYGVVPAAAAPAAVAPGASPPGASPPGASPPGASPSAAMPPGLDDAPVSEERAARAGVAALVSRLAHPDYAPAALEERSGDVDWVGPRAIAHDRVLTWASDRGPVIPFPMFSLFSGERALQTMLDERGAGLAATLGRLGTSREYALRVYRVDAELFDALPALSPRLVELASAAAGAPPGQRYLLERKLDGEKRSEMRAATQRVVDELVDALRAAARATVRSPLSRAAADAEAARGTMVLNAAFLVAPEQLAGFQETLTGLVARRSAQGFRFDFTGPWPPYHFANEPADDR